MSREEILSLAFHILGIPKSLFKSFMVIFEKGEITIREISEHLGLSLRTVQGHISHLMKHGLLKRRPAEKDGRLVYVYKTISPDEIKKLVRDKLKVYREVFGHD